MNENQKRTIHYSFKATPEEDEIIQKKMELTGIKNQSAFIRRIVLGGLILRLDLPELKSAAPGGCMKADLFMKQRWTTLWKGKSSYRIRWTKSLPA